MEVTSINFYGDNGWEYCTDFNYTPSAQLHIPRVGDTIKNKATYYQSTEESDNIFTSLSRNTGWINQMARLTLSYYFN